MRLNPLAFNEFFGKMGQNVTWRRSFSCPCYDVNSGASDMNCPQCSGKGRIWNKAVDCIIAASGQKVQKEWAQFGLWESGDVVVSLTSDQPAYNAGQFDRFLMQNSTDAFSQPLTHDGTDKLYFPVKNINRVFYLDVDSNIVECGIPQVGADGSLTWTSNEPPTGSRYTISGNKFLEYFVFGPMPSNRNMHQGAQMPKRVVLRRFDLFGR